MPSVGFPFRFLALKFADTFNLYVMKNFLLVATLVLFASVSRGQETENFGETVKTKKAVSVADLKAGLEAKESWSGVVTGSVKQVCKKEGCWLRLDDGSADGIMVKMKDHSFTVPKDIDGKTVFVMGQAIKKTTTVAQLRHYAEDAGKTEAEIAAITAPKVEIAFEAKGVKLVQ